ncbi:type VI secretion system tip protein VgrG [Candidatus Fermentibacteria bacterium]|nr:type VI secretion system tip protein VgrG [Candidatus Fermentibacteria bacterium]
MARRIPPSQRSRSQINFNEGAHLGDEDHIQRLHFASGVSPNESMVRNYNHETPALRGMEGHSLALAENAAMVGERRIYAYPGRYATPEQGLRLATRRLEAHRTRSIVAEGGTNSIRLDLGALMQVSNHPQEDSNREYLIWPASLQVLPPKTGDGTFSCRFEAVPSTIPVRPLLVTPKPRVMGSQTAFVVGPSGEEIHTDELGRLKVQFHWDREGADDDHSTCWVRMAQTWAGARFGSIRRGEGLLGEALVCISDRGAELLHLLQGSALEGELQSDGAEVEDRAPGCNITITGNAIKIKGSTVEINGTPVKINC